MKPLLMCALLLSVASATAAEPPQASAGAPPSIKALTPDHVAGLLAGAGLGYAKAAELNRYPGPLHVLELADELGLDAAQREATRALRTRVVEQASALGAELVAAEAELDAMFRSASVSQPAMDEALVRIGTLQSRLRGGASGRAYRAARPAQPGAGGSLCQAAWLRRSGRPRAWRWPRPLSFLR